MRTNIAIKCCPIILGIFIVSCASSPKAASGNNENSSMQYENAGQETEKNKETWLACTDLDCLSGKWESSYGTGFEYPFIADGRTYLRFHSAWKDVTYEWEKIALEQGITVDDLWQKRYTVYSFKNPDSQKIIDYPVADENGIQRGVKFYRGSGHIYVRDETLVTEFIFGKNLKYFLVSEKGECLKTTGTMHLFSNIFSDLSGLDWVYAKVE